MNEAIIQHIQIFARVTVFVVYVGIAIRIISSRVEAYITGKSNYLLVILDLI